MPLFCKQRLQCVKFLKWQILNSDTVDVFLSIRLGFKVQYKDRDYLSLTFNNAKAANLHKLDFLGEKMKSHISK